MNKIINKKKKAFTLIELIIVLAIMAIIAAIAIPNFMAVRDNSKTNADIQSCETIQRTVSMLVTDETIVAANKTELILLELLLQVSSIVAIRLQLAGTNDTLADRYSNCIKE